MARTKTKKVKIMSERLRVLLKFKRMSIVQLGSSIGCNERTIRRGMKEGEMTAQWVMLIAMVLRVDANYFSHWDEYITSFET